MYRQNQRKKTTLAPIMGVSCVDQVQQGLPDSITVASDDSMAGGYNYRIYNPEATIFKKSQLQPYIGVQYNYMSEHTIRASGHPGRQALTTC